MALCEAGHSRWASVGAGRRVSLGGVNLAVEPAASPATASALDLVRLPALMALTEGRSDVVIGLIDGPVAPGMGALRTAPVELGGPAAPACSRQASTACRHGTFVASMLVGERSSPALGIAPRCTVVSRPIFRDEDGEEPSATAQELADAVVETVDAGARVLNVSAALVQSCGRGVAQLEAAFRHASRRGALSVVATGNQGVIGGSIVAAQPWIIPVVGCDLSGRPLGFSNLGRSIGRRGLQAPASGVVGLLPDGTAVSMGGTSVAAPFVTGTIALLWSLFPDATPTDVTLAVSDPRRRRRLVPPVLDASAAYRALQDRVGSG